MAMGYRVEQHNIEEDEPSALGQSAVGQNISVQGAPQGSNIVEGRAIPPISPQQRRFAARGSKGLQVYRQLMVRDRGWPFLCAYESYNILCSGLPGLLGFAARRAFLPWFIGKYRSGAIVGRNVLIRQPSYVTLGRGVIVDDYVVLDLRERWHDDTATENAPSPRIEIGDQCFIGRHSALVAKGGSITLAAGCNISSHCRIATESTIEIGEGVLIAAYAYIGPGNHDRDQSGRVMIEQPMSSKGGVRIGSGSWIGTKATILDGVTIGENAVVGAHSLVREDVPAGAIVAGTPAKIILR